jgi:nicotinamidase/pyrazinamidase
MSKTALGIIDAERGFMPAEEGDRLGAQGFGELPVADGEQIVSPVNALLKAAGAHGIATFTTQDWHPRETAHFAAEPNFTTTWPVHCVAETPGAELHPDIELSDATERFIKGFEPLERGEDDTSYSGSNAINADGESLPNWLRSEGVTEVALGGLALDYCVKATALDLKQEAGLDVTVITDSTRAITPETGRQALEELEAAGVRLATTAEWLERLEATAE